MSWSLFAKTSDEWENYLKEKHSHYRQSFYWGELKRKKNWKVLRAEYKSLSGNIETRVQVLYKKILFINFFFIPGGTIGNPCNLNKLFIDFLVKETKSKFFYLRLDDSSTKEENINFFKNSNLWQIPSYKMHDSICAIYDFNRLDKDFNKNFTRDFRSSVKSSIKKNNIYKVLKNPNSQHLSEISENMFRNKKIKMMNYEDFENLKKYLNKYSIFFVCFDKNEKPLAYRTILIIGNNAWDLAAATSFNGRKLFAGFGILLEVLNYLRSQNISRYDLGAINKKSPGINSFKIGTGAHSTSYVGEYEYSGFKILNFLTNNFIRLTFSKVLQYFFFFRSLYF
jgi:hypothetical protein